MERITLLSTIIAVAMICAGILFASGDDCDVCFSPPVMALKLIVCGFVVMGGAVYFRGKFLEMEGITFRIERQPLLDSNEATDGVPFAGEGIVESEREKLLKSPHTGTDCVYYHSITEEYHHSKNSSYWVITENKTDFVPFHITDRRGKIGVDLIDMDSDFSGYKLQKGSMILTRDPKNSEIDCDAVQNKQQDYIDYPMGPLGILGLKSRQLLRKSEFVLKPDTKVFVYGMASKRKEGIFLHESKDTPLIISKKSKDQYVEEFFKGGSLVYLMYFLIAVGFTVALLSAGYLLHIGLVVLLFPLLIGTALILGMIPFTLYNRIVSLQQRAENALSNIDIELKRRADLIPNIIRAVKKYAKYEKETNIMLVEARAGMAFMKSLPEQSKAPLMIPSLMVSIEKYPELKASQNFQALMRELVDTEERIAYSREFYNRSILKYNTLIQQFPFILISLPLGMRQKEYLSISRGESAVPQVSL